MSNEKKYIIVWHIADGSGHTFYRGLGTKEDIIADWSPDFVRATTFPLSVAREILSKIKEVYDNSQDCRAKIHEYIPAHCGEEVKSDKDRVIEKLKYAIECNNYVIEDMEQADTVFRGVYKVDTYLVEAIRILKDMK